MDYTITRSPTTAVLPVAGLTEEALSATLSRLIELVTDLPGTVFSHPDYKDADNWLAFAFQREGEDEPTSERDFFTAVGEFKGLRKLAEEYVRKLIAYNMSQGGDPLYTDEELETGTGAVRMLAMTDAAYLPLYAEFIKSIDLDHTVEQVSVVDDLIEKYGEDALKDTIGPALSEGMIFTDSYDWVPEWEDPDDA